MSQKKSIYFEFQLTNLQEVDYVLDIIKGSWESVSKSGVDPEITEIKEPAEDGYEIFTARYLMTVGTDYLYMVSNLFFALNHIFNKKADETSVISNSFIYLVRCRDYNNSSSNELAQRISMLEQKVYTEQKALIKLTLDSAFCEEDIDACIRAINSVEKKLAHIGIVSDLDEFKFLKQNMEQIKDFIDTRDPALAREIVVSESPVIN